MGDEGGKAEGHPSGSFVLQRWARVAAKVAEKAKKGFF